MKIPRFFTSQNNDPYHGIEFEPRQVAITDEKGNEVFQNQSVAVPSFWSQTATDILAAKYLWRGDDEHPPEHGARQAIDRLVFAWRQWGETLGYFGVSDGGSYADEMRYMLVHQMGSPNSPQWFNTGLFAAYGARGPAQGHFYVDAQSGQVRPASNSLEYPQAHACFIQSVQDDLVNPGGIMDLWVREARLFKFGSGSGTNFSDLRGEGEPLRSGGVSSGLLSFLRIGDAAAGAIRSGGTTRRAAKMVCVDADHPDIEAFIDWKAREERKVAALIAGGPAYGLHLDADWRHEAYQSVSGQNSNNSVRVSQAFLETVENGGDWPLHCRVGGKVARNIPARSLWNQIARTAWECADPGLQFETTIGDWHTCPAEGPIRASNPCSEYLFLDDTGCNLASLNLLRFVSLETGQFDTVAFRHAVRLWILTLEITVSMAGYPSETIARRSEDYRTLGLGLSNLGSLFMALGIAYDSAQAGALAAGITALLTAEAYAFSAELAAAKGPFAKYALNRQAMLRVLRNHRRVANGQTDFEGLCVAPQVFDSNHCPPNVTAAAREAWDRVLKLGELHGFRNAQVSAIAPTGTIGLVMDCDTMGIEPEFALIKYKTLAGGGGLRIANRSVPLALARLGYPKEATKSIEKYFLEEGTLEGAPGLKTEHYPVFDCANRCGSKGTRVLAADAHLRVVAAVQPFVSGGVSKTINLAQEATVGDVARIHEQAWKRGLKAVSVYRAGCKLSQPLASIMDKDDPSCIECG